MSFMCTSKTCLFFFKLQTVLRSFDFYHYSDKKTTFHSFPLRYSKKLAGVQNKFSFQQDWCWPVSGGFDTL